LSGIFRTLAIVSAVLLLAIAGPAALGALLQEHDDNDPAQAEALIREAIRVRGGERYLQIRSMVSRGQFTPFDKGVPGDPKSFVDYLVYPDHERTEFGRGGGKRIETTSGNSGWVYDAGEKRLRDETEDQLKIAQQSFRYDLDNLLRSAWREQGSKLVFLGRREVWHNTFSRAVRIDFADGASATLHFDPRTKLPLEAEYKMVSKDGTTSEEVRFNRWVEFGGVQFPTIQDFYRDGKQSTRASFDTFEINANIPEKAFVKPASLKEVK